MLRRLTFLMLPAAGCLLWALQVPMGAEPPDSKDQPEILHLFPLGSQRGTSVEMEITGKALQEAYALVFEEEGLTGRVTQVAEVVEKETEDKPKPEEKKARRISIETS